ncbi:hypothetical protein BGZ46_007939 [Entomortierella lignicola]|nr:hypothetical protein BGZ46_007939 [Entomortierella lignicola]
MLTKLSHTHDDTDSVGSHSHNSPSAEAEAEEAVSVTPHRCGHVFQPGEDIYHCRDCSFNDMVVLCSRCFHNSGCVNHRWRMGEFKNPVRESQRSKALKRKERRRQKAAGKSVYKEEEEEQGEKREKQVGHDGELSASGLVDSLDIAEENPSHDASSQKSSLPKSPPAEMNEIDNNDDGGSSDDDDDDDEEIEEEDNDLEQQESEEPVYRISCDCGDPEMFKTAFDCNYHLPQEFRPVPSLIHCNYLFQRNETMFRCRTCHIVDEGNDDNSPAFDSMDETPLSDIWICARCFDPEDHSDHDVEEMLNVRNEGLYCHCGDPTIQRPNLSNAAAGSTTAASTGASLDCRDDHNRQNVLCTTEIKEGMFYYSCKSCQTDSSRLFCEPCFVKEAHEDHSYRRLYASTGFPVTTCGCGENSAFRFATNCQQHERAGGTNIVHRCRYHASAGEWVAFCSDCYPTQEGLVSPYLCLRCRQGSDHTGHNVKWIKLEQDMLYPCACGSHSLSRLAPDNTTITETMTISAFIDLSSNVSTTVIMESDPLESSSAAANSGSKSPVLAARRNSKRSSINSSLSAITSRPTSNLSVASSQSSSSPQLVDKSAGSTAATDTTSSASASAAAASAAASAAAAAEDEGKTIPPALCQYHTMIYKTTPSTTLFLHSHNYRSINHQDHNEVTGYKYHDSNNDWIVRRPGEGEGEVRVAREGGRGRGREDNIPNISISNTNTTTSTNNNTKQIQHLSPYLQWKDVYWLQHANTGKYFNSMASLKISQGFQEVSALESPHSNNDWIIEETTWLRQQILSDE